MATAFPSLSESRPLPYRADQAFFVRMAAGIAALVVFGFLQWFARGFVQPARVPFWVHLHGAAMVGWLGLMVTQNLLAAGGNAALHRRLGWSSLLLVGAIAVLGPLTVVKAVELHRVPPFFTNAYMLALSLGEVMTFVGLFAAAIALRRRTDWHRRLMLGATVIVMEPGIGRILPMPLLGGFAPWAELSVQLGVLAILARHDRKVLGRVHPATWWSAAALVAVHLAIMALAGFAPFVGWAEGIAAGGYAA